MEHLDIWIRLVLMVGIGVAIGWITNYVAIKMLFRPYKEINILGIKIQGLLPKRKHQIGESLADIIQSEIISMQDIAKSIDSNKLETELSATIDEVLDKKLKDEITMNFPMLAMFLNESTLNKIKVIIKKSILENKEKIAETFSKYLEKNVDFRSIIIKNVDDFSLEKLESITYLLAKKEFKHIEIIGGILGGIIGFVQFLIGFLL